MEFNINNITLHLIIITICVLFYTHLKQHTYLNNNLNIVNEGALTKHRIHSLLLNKNVFEFTFSNNQNLLDLLNPENLKTVDFSQSSNNKFIHSFLNGNDKISNILTINTNEIKTLYNEIVIQTLNISPILSTNKIQDVIIIKNNGEIPFTQNVSLAHFITSINNTSTITLIPPSHQYHIDFNIQINDYIKTTSKKNIHLDNIPTIQYKLTQNNTLYIPPFWSYKIKYETNSDEAENINVLLLSSYNNVISYTTKLYNELIHKL
jgi:hypothetical protein